jgi:hypothetical protein
LELFSRRQPAKLERRAIFAAMKFKFLLSLVLLAGLTASAGEATNAAAAHAQFVRQHVFMVDSAGVCLDPAAEWGWDKKLQGPTVSNSLAQISAGLAAWKNSPATTNSPYPARVVVFIHGGMNPYAASKKRVLDTNLIGALTASNCYPLFVVWNSGPFSAYGEHLLYIRQGEKKPLYIGIPTLPLELASDLARGLARLPVTLFGRFYSDAFTTELRSDSALSKVVGDSRTADWENFESLIHEDIPDTYHPPKKEGHARSVANRTIHFTEYVVTLPTKIVSLPLLDGMGSEAWDIMLRRTRTMYEPTASYEISRMVKNLNPSGNRSNQLATVHRWLHPVADDDALAKTNAQSGAMNFFGQRCTEWSTNYTMEFYGHSMGTIVLNQLFRNAPDIQTERIGYLGAACSIEDFKTALFPYLVAHPSAQFYSLSLHRERERDEYPLAGLRVVFLRDLIARGSLLNWVDDIFAKPNTISDRTLGAWENITRALPDVPAALRSQTHFRGCNIEPSAPIRVDNALTRLSGQREPQVHGDFTKAYFWSTNFLWPVGQNRLNLRAD